MAGPESYQRRLTGSCRLGSSILIRYHSKGLTCETLSVFPPPGRLSNFGASAVPRRGRMPRGPICGDRDAPRSDLGEPRAAMQEGWVWGCKAIKSPQDKDPPHYPANGGLRRILECTFWAAFSQLNPARKLPGPMEHGGGWRRLLAPCPRVKHVFLW